MGKLSDWVRKNAKEGADISEAEALIETLSIDGVTSKEKAIDFIIKNDVFKKGLDSYVSKSIENHDNRFKEDKLPGILEAEREKFKSELNPPKDEKDEKLDKVLKEMEAIKAEKAQTDLRLKLRSKAKELNYPEDQAEALYEFGEKSLSLLERNAEQLESLVNSRYESKVKERFGDNPEPQKREPIDPKSLDEQIIKARQEGNTDVALKLQLQKQQTQQ